MTSALTVFSVLAVTSIGCADVTESRLPGRNTPAASTASPENGPTPEGKEATFTVTGRISSEGRGAIEQGLAGSRVLVAARSVDVLALAVNGDLVPVAQTDVKPGGAFTAIVPPGASPTGVFILEVKDLAGAVVGSGVVNGLPAFVKAFVVDAPIDTATSFKAEILVTLAKKGVPGVQNYLNVIDTFVNAELADSIAVAGVLTTDLTTLIGATSDAVIAAEDVIVDALQKAGIPVDLSALQKTQASVISGVQGLVTSSTGSLVTTSKNLVASLEAATAKAAKPIDQAIFNAIVNGGAAFATSIKTSVPSKTLAGGAGKPDLGFAVSKAMFSLETALTTGSVADAFQKNGVTVGILDAVTKGCATFTMAVANASSPADLEAAKAAFKSVLLDGTSKNSLLVLLADAFADLAALVRGVDATLAPLATTLTTAFATHDKNAIGEGLANFDAGTTTALPAKLKAALDDKDAHAIADALRLLQKQVVK
jgi:hypothetical protein